MDRPHAVLECHSHLLKYDGRSRTSVIVHDLDLFCASVSPSETQAPLIVDADAVLAGAIPVQGLQAIAGRRGQELECLGRVHLRELARGDLRDRAKSLRASCLKEGPSLFAAEALDHWGTLYRLPVNSKDRAASGVVLPSG